MDDDYTARAAIRQSAPVGCPADCGVEVHRRLTGVDDASYDYTTRAAIRQPAPAGCPADCSLEVHRRLAGVDDASYDYTARAAIRQPAPAGCCVVVYEIQPSGGRPLAG